MDTYPLCITVAGAGRKGFVDGGSLSDAYFDGPLEMCAMPDQKVLIADGRNNCLRVVDLVRGVVTTVPSHAFLGCRSPVLIDGGAAVVVIDSGHNKLRMLQIHESPDGSMDVDDSNIAGCGRAALIDGPADSAAFRHPSGLAVLNDGSILVADTGNHSIRRIAARAGKPGLYVTTIAGTGAAGLADGDGASARFNSPTTIAVDSFGAVLVSDTGNNAVRAMHAKADGSGGWIVSTLVGSGAAGYSDGCSAHARVREPCGLAIGSGGHLLIADSGNNAIRALSPAQQVPGEEDSEVDAVLVGCGEQGEVGYVDAIDAMDIAGGPEKVAALLPVVTRIAADGSTGVGRTVVVSPVLLRTASTANPDVASRSRAAAILDAVSQLSRSPGSSTPSIVILHQNPIAVVRTHQMYGWVETVAGASPDLVHAMSAQADKKMYKPACLPAAGLHDSFLSAATSQAMSAASATTATEKIKRYADGPSRTSARFRRPHALCVLSGVGGAGSVLITDSGNHFVRLLVSSEAVTGPAVPFLLTACLTPHVLAQARGVLEGLSTAAGAPTASGAGNGQAHEVSQASWLSDAAASEWDTLPRPPLPSGLAALELLAADDAAAEGGELGSLGGESQDVDLQQRSQKLGTKIYAQKNSAKSSAAMRRQSTSASSATGVTADLASLSASRAARLGQPIREVVETTGNGSQMQNPARARSAAAPGKRQGARPPSYMSVTDSRARAVLQPPSWLTNQRLLRQAYPNGVTSRHPGNSAAGHSGGFPWSTTSGSGLVGPEVSVLNGSGLHNGATGVHAHNDGQDANDSSSQLHLADLSGRRHVNVGARDTSALVRGHTTAALQMLSGLNSSISDRVARLQPTSTPAMGSYVPKLGSSDSFAHEARGRSSIFRLAAGMQGSGRPSAQQERSVLHGNKDPMGVGLLAAAALASPVGSAELDILTADPDALLSVSASLLSSSHSYRTGALDRQHGRVSHTVVPVLPAVLVGEARLAASRRRLGGPEVSFRGEDGLWGDMVRHNGSRAVGTTAALLAAESYGAISPGAIRNGTGKPGIAGLQLSAAPLTRTLADYGSRDALAAEKLDASGAVVRALMLADAPATEADAKEAIRRLEHEPADLSRSTLAPARLVTARFVRHTLSSASRHRERGMAAPLTAPAFANVPKLVAKKVEQLKARAAEAERQALQVVASEAAAEQYASIGAAAGSRSSVNNNRRQSSTAAAAARPRVDVGYLIAAAVSPGSGSAVTDKSVETGQGQVRAGRGSVASDSSSAPASRRGSVVLPRQRPGGATSSSTDRQAALASAAAPPPVPPASALLKALGSSAVSGLNASNASTPKGLGQDDNSLVFDASFDVVRALHPSFRSTAVHDSNLAHLRSSGLFAPTARDGMGGSTPAHSTSAKAADTGLQYGRNTLLTAHLPGTPLSKC